MVGMREYHAYSQYKSAIWSILRPFNTKNLQTYNYTLSAHIRILSYTWYRYVTYRYVGIVSSRIAVFSHDSGLKFRFQISWMRKHKFGSKEINKMIVKKIHNMQRRIRTKPWRINWTDGWVEVVGMIVFVFS